MYVKIHTNNKRFAITVKQKINNESVKIRGQKNEIYI